MPKIEGGTVSAELRQRVGRHIREARKKKRWTQADLAAEINCSNTTVCDWERGRSYPGAENSRKLAKALGERVSFLLADHLGRKDSVEALSREIGTALGYNRLSALVLLSEGRLRREVDAMIGRYVAEEGGLPSRRSHKG